MASNLNVVLDRTPYLCATITAESGPKVDKGLGVLEWTGSVIPQGLLVKGTLHAPV